MDTTKLELQAENFISSQLSKYDFLVSKPKYDINGCDLQILDNLESPLKLIRIQSKGRSISSDTNVKIPTEYISDDFVLFIYLVDESKNEELYVFFPKHLKFMNLNEKNLIIYLSKKTYKTKYKDYKFSESTIETLKELLQKSRIKNETSLIIDGFCLDNAIKNTLKTYENIYPEREFNFPDDPIDIIKNIIKCYDKKKLENRILNIYLFTTPYNSIRTKYYDSNELFLDNNKIRIFEMRIDGLVWVEIEDYLKRVINSENIIFVASDRIYLPLLQNLKDENKEVVLVCEKLENGLRNYGFHWGDITYPVGLSLGLSYEEL